MVAALPLLISVTSRRLKYRLNQSMYHFKRVVRMSFPCRTSARTCLQIQFIVGRVGLQRPLRHIQDDGLSLELHVLRLMPIPSLSARVSIWIT